jgi:hypothetical protein
MRIIAWLILFCATFVVLPLSSSAGPITVPTGLAPGTQYRLAFLTSTTTDATSSDIGYYNTFVTNTANSVPQLAALETTWSAIASTAAVDALDNTDTNPSTLDPSVPIYGLANALIASGNDALWGGYEPVYLQNGTNERGQPLGPAAFWYGSNYGDGYPGYTLGSTPSVLVLLTLYNSGVYQGYDLTADPATSLLPVAAMSGVLTVPFPTPEPSTLVLACLAATGLAVTALRRRKR